jgi:major membrane immunogen (membrane-anchored lipoprotein)
MKNIHALLVAGLVLAACNSSNTGEAMPATQKKALPIIGTWQLISGTTIEKNDTTVTYYTKELSFIKIINDTHFAFLKHDLNKGKDTTASFGAGGGKYSLTDSTYTEHLEYCNDRQWENNDFSFTVTIQNDTLVQSGIEKVESAGINRINIEKYVRVK